GATGGESIRPRRAGAVSGWACGAAPRRNGRARRHTRRGCAGHIPDRRSGAAAGGSALAAPFCEEGDRVMLTSFLQSRLADFSKRYDYDTTYLQELAEADAGG